jgi:3-dehydroquinate synthetase
VDCASRNPSRLGFAQSAGSSPDESGEMPAVLNEDLRYPIYVGRDVRSEVRALLERRAQRYAVLCDAAPEVVGIARELSGAPECIGLHAVKLGEARKRFSTVERVHEWLLAAGADRSTLVLGVGGGVASDLFGFAAATYMRGVPYAHIATTLVAMVDAAIGGKTGVDLRGGKNLAGVFRDPVAVFSHVGALWSLPLRSLREGLAEVVKACLIEGGQLFESLEALSAHPFPRWPWVELVGASIKVKTMIVADDREEAGMRELLNLGHTFAHGIEAASGYRVTHGAAVALGLRAAGLLALRTGRYSEEEHLRVLATLALLGMPLRTALDPEQVAAAMQSDKKKRNGNLRFVLPRAIGDVEYGVEVSERQVTAVLRQLQRAPDDAG